MNNLYKWIIIQPAIICIAPARADNWPQFRGSQSNQLTHENQIHDTGPFRASTAFANGTCIFRGVEYIYCVK